MANRLICPRRDRRRPQTGHVMIYRPPRTKEGRRARRYSPRDAGRVAQYAACAHNPVAVMCEVVRSLGLEDEIALVRERIEALQREVDEQNEGVIGTSIGKFLLGMVTALLLWIRKIRRGLEKSRFLRWVLKRFLIYTAIIAVLEILTRLLVLLELIAEMVEPMKELLEKMVCDGEEEVSDGGEENE